jgi:excisionase family DNA binding protein
MTITVMPGADLLTTAEACQQLRISRMTLWRYVKDGRISPIRLSPRAVRYRPEDLDAITIDHIDNDAETIRTAFQFLAERHAEEQRPLCPSCGKRRVNRGASQCTWCQQNHETQLLHKRRWWDANGNTWRDQRREEANG